MQRFTLLTVVALAGCAAPLPLPMTAGQLTRYDSGPALVAYLGQRDASPVVCDLRARGPHLTALTPEVRDALVDGLVEGRIEPALWRRCVEGLVKGLAHEEAASLSDALARADRSLLAKPALQSDPALAERVATLQQLYLDRRDGFDGHPSVVAPLFDELREAVAHEALGPVATRFAHELLTTLDVEHGRWQGRPVDVALMDALAANGNEMTLTRFAERLPDLALREQARRRLVRIHVALSAFPEVREAAAAVEDTVVRQGEVVVHRPSIILRWRTRWSGRGATRSRSPSTR